MTATLLQSEADQDRFLLDIYELSRRFAVLKVRKQEVDDFVQDIALHCLIKLREGIWTHTPENIHAFVWKLVKNRAADGHRRHARDVEFKKAYARTLDGKSPEWMSPDRSHDEEVMTSLQRRVVRDLPRRCREVYVLVREEGMTEAEAAYLLDISPLTVHRQMTIATRILSKQLRRHGWLDGRRTAESPWRTKVEADDRTHFAPDFPVPEGRSHEKEAEADPEPKAVTAETVDPAAVIP